MRLQSDPSSKSLEAPLLSFDTCLSEGLSHDLAPLKPDPLLFVTSLEQVSSGSTKRAEMACEGSTRRWGGEGGFVGWNVWKLQFNLSFGSWQFMQIRISLNPALGLNDDSLMGVSRLFRVSAEMKVLNVAQTVIRTDEPSYNSTLYTEGKCKKKKEKKNRRWCLPWRFQKACLEL